MKDFLEKIKDIDNKTRFASQKKMASKFKNIFGKYDSSNNYNYQSTTEVVDLISASKKTDAYIARTFSSILQQTLKNGWSFESNNKENAKKIEKRFENLLLNSNTNARAFIRDILKSYIDYSNVFIHKAYRENKRKPGEKFLDNLIIFPSRGWSPRTQQGPFVTEWNFEINAGITSSYEQYNSNDIYHLSYNKETHEIFGTPFVLSIIDDVQLLRDLEATAMEDFFKQTNKKTIVYIGDNIKPAMSSEITQVSDYLNQLDPDESIVLNGRCKVEILATNYNDGTPLITLFRERVLAGLMASSTSMGIVGAGRQDADTQSGRELITVEDFQENLEDTLNNTLFRELCLEEFGSFNVDNMVKIKFGKDYNSLERSNNHYSNLYATGAIDFDELREKIGYGQKIFNEKNSFNSKKLKNELKVIEETARITAKYTPTPTTTSTSNSTTKKTTKKASGASAAIASKNQPSNQHGKKTTSKASVKN